MSGWDKLRTVTAFLEAIDQYSLIWAVKRLSGNDTGLTGGHQAGVYLPRGFFERAFPEICRKDEYNPKAVIAHCIIPAIGLETTRLRATYYNSKFHPELGLAKAYDEFRLTGWGGRQSPVQDPESTGSVAVFAVSRAQADIVMLAWVASNIEEETTIEDWLGAEIEPGRCFIQEGEVISRPGTPAGGIPDEWYRSFPTGREIFEFVTRQIPRATWRYSIDKLLMERRAREFAIFRDIERKHVETRLNEGFATVEQFMSLANSVTNRRKSRAGTSLELNLEATFRDEKLIFESQVITENHKRPDFLFPSGRAYHDSAFEESRLRMLAAKTCCRDRWRQVVNEAGRISVKHLFTLQEGISSNQLKEMRDAQIVLVVPKPNIRSFPQEERPRLLTLEGFVGQVKATQTGVDLSRWTT